jgi:hypothetical protein
VPVSAKNFFSLDVELVRAESLRATRERANDPDAVDLAMRGWAAINQGADSIILTTARGYFEQALVIDPQLPKALLCLARALTLRANDEFAEYQGRLSARSASRVLYLRIAACGTVGRLR